MGHVRLIPLHDRLHPENIYFIQSLSFKFHIILQISPYSLQTIRIFHQSQDPLIFHQTSQYFSAINPVALAHLCIA